MVWDEKYIQETYKLAYESVQNGNHPFGALLVDENSIVIRYQNTVNTSSNPINHAELNLISQACQTMDFDRLSQLTLYSSTEPCAMCAGAIYWSGISAVVFGVRGELMCQFAGKSMGINMSDVFERCEKKIEVRGPVLEAEGMRIHKKFWKK